MRPKGPLGYDLTSSWQPHGLPAKFALKKKNGIPASLPILLIAEILHHPGCMKHYLKKPVNNRINYQPQLVSRISAINCSIHGTNGTFSYI